MKNKVKKSFFDRLFSSLIGLKGFFGVLDLIGAASLFFVTPAFLNMLVDFLRAESGEAQHIFTPILQHILPVSFSANMKMYAAFYLSVHGIVNLGLVVGLLRRRRLWVYPLAAFIFGISIIYQLFRYTNTHSLFLLILTIFDIIIIGLILIEWRRLKSRQKSK